MRNIALFLCLLTGFALTSFITTSHSKNYEQIICDDEPDPDICLHIQQWYANAKQPHAAGEYLSSCCGTADAYWVDKVDKIIDAGVFVTVTDDRQITYRIPRNSQTVFIPKERLDDRFQGNPTGHNVVFLTSGITYYFNDEVPYPTVICAFLNFAG